MENFDQLRQRLYRILYEDNTSRIVSSNGSTGSKDTIPHAKN